MPVEFHRGELTPQGPQVPKLDLLSLARGGQLAAVRTERKPGEWLRIRSFERGQFFGGLHIHQSHVGIRGSQRQDAAVRAEREDALRIESLRGGDAVRQLPGAGPIDLKVQSPGGHQPLAIGTETNNRAA